MAQPFRAVSAWRHHSACRRRGPDARAQKIAGPWRYAYRLHARLDRSRAGGDRSPGRQSGIYDTYIRTDSQWITKQPVPLPARNAKNLNDFDAVFLFISGEGDWTRPAEEDFVSFVKDDGKGVVGAHTGNAAFYEWPEFGEMMGGYFDNHPWGIFDGRVVVDAPDFPAMRHFAPSFNRSEEFYVLREKPYSREKVRVLAHLDTADLDLKHPNYHRKDADLPVAHGAHLRQGPDLLVELRPRRRDVGRSRHPDDVSRGHQVGDGAHAGRRHPTSARALSRSLHQQRRAREGEATVAGVGPRDN